MLVLALGGVLGVVPVAATGREAGGASGPSAAVQALRAEVLSAGGHDGRAFLVIDKRQARMWLFDAVGNPAGDTAVLLGAAVGDHSVPGIGERPLAAVQPHERTTPAGRFVLEAGRNLRGEDIWWVDYDAAVSMHRVRTTLPAERRLERLASPTPRDNRISYGCINVPADFYDGPLRRLLGADGRPGGIAYILPEVAPGARSPSGGSTMELQSR